MRPPLLTQLRNFVADAIKVTTSGFAMSSETEREKRMAKCVACPKYVDGRCDACGCFIAVKILFEAEACPDGHWGVPLYAPPEVTRARAAVCDTCPSRSGRRCKECTCNVYHITALAPNSCPKGKWDA